MFSIIARHVSIVAGFDWDSIDPVLFHLNKRTLYIVLLVVITTQKRKQGHNVKFTCQDKQQMFVNTLSVSTDFTIYTKQWHNDSKCEIPTKTITTILSCCPGRKSPDSLEKLHSFVTINFVKHLLWQILNYLSLLVNSANVMWCLSRAADTWLFLTVYHSFSAPIAFSFHTVLLNNVSFGIFIAQNRR